MIEINWGKPVSFVLSDSGSEQKISTIEQAQFWLEKRWPIHDDQRSHALGTVRAAMECLQPVEAARAAFATAAHSAGFRNIRAH